MVFFEKKKYLNGKREFYLLGRKIFEYVNWKKYKLHYGIMDYNTMLYTEHFEFSKTEYPIISIIYPVYYTNDEREAFNRLVERYNNFSVETKKRFELIFVDDGSPCPIKLPKANLNMTLLRINIDKKWNNSGARNLGACYASTPRLILMDEDWFVPEKTLKFLMSVKLTNRDIMPLAWSHSEDDVPNRVLPNLFCLNKQTFFNLNCYDESWCGFYGEDLFFRRYIMTKDINFILSKYIIIPSKEEYITNSSHNLSRNLDEAKKRLSKFEKPVHKKMILQFPWEYVESYTFTEEN